MTGGKRHAIVAWGIVSLVLSGCAPGLGAFQGRKRSSPPLNSQDLGLIVRGVSEASLAQLLNRHEGVTYRELNSKHGMFEIYGLDQDQVARELKNARVTKNQFFASPRPSPGRRIRAWAEEGASASDKLEKCEDHENPPVPVISVQTLQEDVEKHLLPRNADLVLTAESSENASFPGQPLKVAWVIMRPEGSRVQEEIVVASSLTLKTEAMGAYGVGLVVQDQNKACGLEVLEFGVTGNANYVKSENGKDTLNPAIDLSQLWHLKDLNAEKGWELSTGKGVVIGVIDSGVNFNHPALRDNILVNEKEIPDNNIDDDGNGFIDDTVGWDFNFNDNSPFDDYGHGSHVAGLAASSIFGLAKDAKILPVKALGAFGGDAASVSAAIRYAVDRGVQIINLSLGTYEGPNPEVVDAVNYAEQKGVLLVVASGNGHPMTGVGVNTDEFAHFPSTFENKNILTVAAIDRKDHLTLYSNYGANSVDIATYGGDEEEKLTSSYLDNPAGTLMASMSGTSMATPLVAGLAAQIWALSPTATAEQVRAVILSRGQDVSSLLGVTSSGRKMDVLSALTTGNLDFSSRLSGSY